MNAVAAEEVTRARTLAANAGRVVVKAGTNSLTNDVSKLDDGKLDKLVDDIADLIDRDKEVVLVSSGAIGAGKGRVGFDPDDTVEESQAVSTIGQSHLMRRYTESFERYDLTVAQILVTDNDLEDPERFTNFKNTVETLLSWGVVPIINENDAVATEEIRIGDNDMISASVTVAAGADLLVTLTDVDGVYTGNPKRDADAALIEAVDDGYERLREIVGDGTETDFGGIRTKVEGAHDVSRHGIPAIIAGSAERDVLARIAAGKPTGTLFVPEEGDDDE